MNCKFCGSPMPEDSAFCPECGAHNSQTAQDGVFCPQCGTEVFPDDLFCPECGRAVDRTSFEQPPTQPSQPTQPQQTWQDMTGYYSNGYANNNAGYNNTYTQKKKGNTGLIIAVIAAVAAVVLGVIAFLKWDDIMGIFSEKQDNPIVSETVKPEETELATEKPEIPTEEPDEDSDEYKLDKEHISVSELDSMSRDEIRLMLNEMYARHGFIFSQTENIEYFNNQSWYIPITDDQNEVIKDFNSIEMDNRKIITDYEYEHGWRPSRV